MVVEFIDVHRDRFGVEPICAVLTEHGCGIAPSTYYAAKTRPASARSLRDEIVLADIRRVHGSPRIGRGLYGARKVWHELRREQARGEHLELGAVPRCQVERLMRAAGLRGVRRDKGFITTRSDPAATRAPDLVNRDFIGISRHHTSMMNDPRPDLGASTPRRRSVIALVGVATVVAVVVLGFAITLRNEEIDEIDETDGRTTPTARLAVMSTSGDAEDDVELLGDDLALIVAQPEGPSVTSFDATIGDPLWAEAYSPDGTSAQPAADNLVALSGRELRIVDRDGEERWRDAIDPSAGRLADSLVHGLE